MGQVIWLLFLYNHQATFHVKVQYQLICLIVNVSFNSKIKKKCLIILLWLLQHPDLTVTSEERVFTAILLWCIHAKELWGWEEVDELIMISTLESLLGERLQSANDLLLYVRFPLLPYALLKKVS